jgi:hypothetical protein
MIELKKQSFENSSHLPAVRGFGQLFGLHPIPAATTFVVNEMLFVGAVFSMGTLALLAPIVAVALGIITYKSQRRFYDDDHDAALVKALAVGLISAIPVGIPAFLTVPAGVVGLVHNLRKGNSHE